MCRLLRRSTGSSHTLRLLQGVPLSLRSCTLASTVEERHKRTPSIMEAAVPVELQAAGMMQRPGAGGFQSEPSGLLKVLSRASGRMDSITGVVVHLPCLHSTPPHYQSNTALTIDNVS